MQTPWFKHAILYSLNIKTFLDSNGDGIGDFQGVINSLGYLSNLGITCIWLLPFYPSPRKDDGYDITDYFKIDPRYGTLADFDELLKKADNYKIKIIIDLVVHHTSDHTGGSASRELIKPRGTVIFISGRQRYLKKSSGKLNSKESSKLFGHSMR